ncbi:MAG: hypothetical protein LKI42_01005 [Bacteroidales bacterium]|jgi:hypothetical protein|nr:hypothetical protein [Bacteroidales bacterium]MCI1784674.1 hypothetical protein [Bacteroidales bacterium]
MKLRYLLLALIAGLAIIAVGCTENDDIKTLDEIQVSSSFVSIDMAGGSATIKVTAKDSSWHFDESTIPSWLTVSPMSGNPGETTVTFTAPETLTGKGNIDVQIICAGKTQHVDVIQGVKIAEPSTCAQVLAGTDGKSYQVTGVCTRIASTTYGNWYIEDATGSVYIYGTLDSNDKFNWSSMGIDVGDVVTVEGPRSTYGTTVELVNVHVVSVSKSLVKVESDPVTLAKESAAFDLELTCKGDGLSIVIPDEAKSWLHVSSLVTSGTSATVSFFADENTGLAPRSATVTFTSSISSQSSSVTSVVTQKGNLPDPVSIASIDPASTSYACVVGKVTAISKQAYVLTDTSASVQVYYGRTFTPDDYAIGKIRTVAGAISVYNFGMEMSNIDYDVLGSGKITVPAVTVVDGAGLDAMIAATSGKSKSDPACPVKYIEVTGTLAVTVSGTSTYYNLHVSGASTAIGSLSYPLDSFGLADMNGENVTIQGYTTSISGGKYVNIIVTSVTKN